MVTGTDKSLANNYYFQNTYKGTLYNNIYWAHLQVFQDCDLFQDDKILNSNN